MKGSDSMKNPVPGAPPLNAPTGYEKPAQVMLAQEPIAESDAGRVLDTHSIVTWDIIERVRRMRFNPYTQLTAQYLGQALDQFMWGYQRQAQMLWDQMIARDDALP